jgi:ribose transport system permease protein
MSQTQLRSNRINRDRRSKRESLSTFFQVAGILPILVAICILFAVLSPSFLTAGNLINVVRQASINIVLAAGMTFVILTVASIFRSARFSEPLLSLRS